MRVVIAALVILFLANVAYAQDEPLGDVARKARMEKSQSRTSSKVLTNEDFGPHLEPVGENDDPLDVVNKARLALLADTGHTCLRETSADSGPGSSGQRLIEVSGRNRVHMVITDSKPKLAHGEIIIVGEDAFRRTEGGPWEKMDPREARFAVPGADATLPEVLKFSYNPGDLKLVGSQTINGAPTFLYEHKIHVSDMDRTIDIWVGAKDHLPRKTYMVTETKSSGGAPHVWHESASCTYGPIAKIEPPM